MWYTMIYNKQIKFLYQPTTACHIYVKLCEILIYMYVFTRSCDNQINILYWTKVTHTRLQPKFGHFNIKFTIKKYKRKDSSFIY